jgi:4-hydroxybenzoate polyprenyltransferase
VNERLNVFLRLGRVSNLPTVWSNAIAGAVLCGAPLSGLAGFGAVLLSALALSLFYVGGMWLNDAFDAQIDAQERATRPIPLGQIGRNTVFAGGGGMLALGVLLAWTQGPWALGAGVALAAAVVAYDWLHKRTVFSPVIMGTTRFFCYMLPAAALGAFSWPLALGALGLFAYVNGLTYAAKQEAYDRLDTAWPLGVLAMPLFYALVTSGGVPLALVLWLSLSGVVAYALWRLFRRRPGDVPKAVVTLIAGISLYDAALIAATGAWALALVAAACFGATLWLQRVAPGT